MDVKRTLPRILVYQDEDCTVMVDYLKFTGFDIITTSEDNVIEKLRAQNYDLCILGDFGSNIPSNLKLLHFLRNINKKMPVIFISDLYDCHHVIEAFNSGADDYVIRPYNLEELVCRINALLRRCGIKARSIKKIYNIGNYVFNTEYNILTIDSTEIKLTAKETKLLALLCAYENELLSKDLLLGDIWKNNSYFEKRSLDVHVCRLRKYLESDKRISINTYRGLGYSLVIE